MNRFVLKKKCFVVYRLQIITDTFLYPEYSRGRHVKTVRGSNRLK